MSNWVSNNSLVSNGMSNWVSNNSSLNYSRSILRNSFVCYILNNSVSIVSILDSLNSTIRKGYGVTTRRNITISVFRLLEVSPTVIIIDTILVCIYWGFSKIRSCYQGTCRGSSSKGEEGSSKNCLHV